MRKQKPPPPQPRDERPRCKVCGTVIEFASEAVKHPAGWAHLLCKEAHGAH